MKRLVELALKTNGGLDVIYANAGISGGTPSLFEQTEEQWKTILQVNLIGPMLAIQIGAPAMIKRGKGAIVCTASVAGLRSGAGGAGLFGLESRRDQPGVHRRQQLAGTNVRVNGICPGLIETGMTKPIFDRAAREGNERQDRPAQPAAPRRPAGRDRQGRPCSWPRTMRATSTGRRCAVDGGLSSSLPVVPGKMA